MIRRATPVLLAAALVTGCASTDWVYERRGATPARIDRDMAVCRQEAADPRVLAVSASARIDREVFNHCMERKGYTVRRAE